MFEGDICWRIIHSGRIAYFKQGSKLFSGERLHSATMIRVWPFSAIGVVNFGQIGEGRLSWGLFSKINSLVAIFSAFSAPHGKSRSPKLDLPTLLKMRRAALFYQEHAGPADRADISHVRMHVRQ
jgi:hypothetical protein